MKKRRRVIDPGPVLLWKVMNTSGLWMVFHKTGVDCYEECRELAELVYNRQIDLTLA